MLGKPFHQLLTDACRGEHRPATEAMQSSGQQFEDEEDCNADVSHLVETVHHLRNICASWMNGLFLFEILVYFDLESIELVPGALGRIHFHCEVAILVIIIDEPDCGRGY